MLDQSFVWYLDTDASHHVTLDLASLYISDEYKGKDKLIASNGTRLPIFHIGYSSMKTHAMPLLLDSILHMLKINKPLLSV